MTLNEDRLFRVLATLQGGRLPTGTKSGGTVIFANDRDRAFSPDAFAPLDAYYQASQKGCRALSALATSNRRNPIDIG
jgi:hypothetical protein